MTPLVSVIIPTYNRAHLLPQALDSVLAQTYPHHEIVVVDDGSTDNTATVLSRYPVRLIQQNKQGPSAARNRGIRESQGDYIAFLDSDDWFAPDKLQQQVTYLEQQPTVGLVYSAYQLQDDDQAGRVQRIETPPVHSQRDLLWRCMAGPLVTPTVMVRRTVFDGLELFDEQMELAEDIDLWCRITRRWGITMLPDALSTVRAHRGSLSRDLKPTLKLKAWLRILEKAFADNPELDAVFRRRVYARVYYAAAVNAWFSQQRNRIPRYLATSLAWWPIPEYALEDGWKLLTNRAKWHKLGQRLIGRHG